MLRKIIGNFFFPYLYNVNSYLNAAPSFVSTPLQLDFLPIFLLLFFGRALRFNCPRLRSCLGLFVIYVTISVNRA